MHRQHVLHFGFGLLSRDVDVEVTEKLNRFGDAGAQKPGDFFFPFLVPFYSILCEWSASFSPMGWL
jgi:hypothetical protein